MKQDEIRATLGSNIKRLRTLNRLSQEELAEKVDISANFLSSIEIGKKWVSPSTLAKLSDALSVESYVLFKPQNHCAPDIQNRTEEIFQIIEDSIERIRAAYRLQDAETRR